MLCGPDGGAGAGAGAAQCSAVPTAAPARVRGPHNALRSTGAPEEERGPHNALRSTAAPEEAKGPRGDGVPRLAPPKSADSAHAAAMFDRPSGARSAGRVRMSDESFATQRSGAILIGPPRDPVWFGRATQEETLPTEVRRSLKTQQHAHPSTESVEECVQVRRRRSTGPYGSLDDGAKIDPVLRPGAHCVPGTRSVGARA